MLKFHFPTPIPFNQWLLSIRCVSIQTNQNATVVNYLNESGEPNGSVDASQPAPQFRLRRDDRQATYCYGSPSIHG